MTIVLSLLVIGICIYLLAIITDEFFISSLDEIAHRLKLPHNVAGASLMAMGSSAPELAIALIALFAAQGSHSDVGIGTIVGSAIFNILIIPGVSAIFKPPHVTWRVIVRDIVMYVISVALLLASISDGVITLPEALIYLGVYAVYIFILYRWESFVPGREVDIVDLVEEEISQERVRLGLFFRFTAVVSRGLRFLTGDPERNFVRAFFVSIIFIAAISYALVESAVLLAEGLGIPPVIVALTILAGGTSVPDMFASIVVARQGRGEMAVANAVGSNVFDILIGLGLPWVLAILLLGKTVAVGTEGLWSSAILLLGTVILLFLFLTTGRRLSRREGWVLVLLYVTYVIWAWLST